MAEGTILASESQIALPIFGPLWSLATLGALQSSGLFGRRRKAVPTISNRQLEELEAIRERLVTRFGLRQVIAALLFSDGPWNELSRALEIKTAEDAAAYVDLLLQAKNPAGPNRPSGERVEAAAHGELVALVQALVAAVFVADATRLRKGSHRTDVHSVLERGVKLLKTSSTPGSVISDALEQYDLERSNPGATASELDYSAWAWRALQEAR